MTQILRSYRQYSLVLLFRSWGRNPRSRLDCARPQSHVSVHLPGRRAVMRNVSDKEREKLSAEIAGLESLDLNQLRARWNLLYETEAPPHLSQDLIRRAVAY